jgi:hypothetical protein
MRSGAVSAREEFSDEHRCTEFTTDHGLSQSDASDVFGAAICPECGNKNPLTGELSDFHEQVIRCMGCTRVLILDGTALVAFESEVFGDE